MVAFLIAAALVLAGVAAVFIFWGGTIVGDHVWPWESANADDDDDTWFPPLPLPEEAKKALSGLLILGALILGATLLKGRGK